MSMRMRLSMSVLVVGILAAVVAACGDDREVLSGSAGRSESDVVGAEARPPDPADNPCAADAKPSMDGGWICGPSAPPGNGDGADGVCAGSEITAPCGPGVEPDTYYAFTLPGGCGGRISFDGRQWVSQLPPPSPQPNVYVWMRLSASGELRFIAPGIGSVGFVPTSGTTTDTCRSR
jgi:hypothetical protein